MTGGGKKVKIKCQKSLKSAKISHSCPLSGSLGLQKHQQEEGEKKKYRLVLSLNHSASPVGADQSRDLIQIISLLYVKQKKKEKGRKKNTDKNPPWLKVELGRAVTAQLTLNGSGPRTHIISARLGCLSVEVGNFSFLSGPLADPDARSQMQLFHHFFFPPSLSLRSRALSLSLFSVSLALQLAQRLWLHVADVRRAGADARIHGRCDASFKERSAAAARQLVCAFTAPPFHRSHGVPQPGRKFNLFPARISPERHLKKQQSKTLADKRVFFKVLQQ